LKGCEKNVFLFQVKVFCVPAFAVGEGTHVETHPGRPDCEPKFEPRNSSFRRRLLSTGPQCYFHECCLFNVAKDNFTVCAFKNTIIATLSSHTLPKVTLALKLPINDYE
jgi:hypothetical protein